MLDIRLPGLDGWEVLDQIRAEPATRELPVIIVSILDEKARGLACGADDYLVKPVARDDLVSALREVGALPTPGGVAMSAARILVVEDNALNLKLIRDVLQFAGL